MLSELLAVKNRRNGLPLRERNKAIHRRIEWFQVKCIGSASCGATNAQGETVLAGIGKLLRPDFPILAQKIGLQFACLSWTTRRPLKNRE